MASSPVIRSSSNYQRTKMSRRNPLLDLRRVGEYGTGFVIRLLAAFPMDWSNLDKSEPRLAKETR